MTKDKQSGNIPGDEKTRITFSGQNPSGGQIVISGFFFEGRF